MYLQKGFCPPLSAPLVEEPLGIKEGKGKRGRGRVKLGEVNERPYQKLQTCQNQECCVGLTERGSRSKSLLCRLCLQLRGISWYCECRL